MVICVRLMGIITPVIDWFDFFWGIWEGFMCSILYSYDYDLDLFVLCLCIDHCSHYPNKTRASFGSVTGSVHIHCLLDKSLYPETSKQTKLSGLSVENMAI